MRFPYQALLAIMALFLAACGTRAQATEPSLDDFWAGNAHFEEVRKLDWSTMTGGSVLETSSWFAIAGRKWYSFSRAPVAQRNRACPDDNMQTVVRVSSDEGVTWSAPVVAAVPGSSGRADGCAILDGASIYHAATDTWHMLAQCLALHSEAGWAMCHYTRKGSSPLGRFTGDAANPVIRQGQLWQTLCADRAGVCNPAGTRYEGTPDILRVGSDYYVTFHGYEQDVGIGVRGVAVTRDFRTWRTRGADLPRGAMLGPADCQRFVRGCVGVGTATTLETDRYSYTLFEAMDRNLMCTAGQIWVFSAGRVPRGVWPASGSSQWEWLRGAPLIEPGPRAKGLPCAVQYARWFEANGTTWLVYEERELGHNELNRRLFKLVPGTGPARLVKDPAR